MKLALITDAWHPQVNGVVTTLHELVEALGPLGVEVTVLHPGQFKNRPCPGYAGIDLAVRPYKALAAKLDNLLPDAVHIATEGPLAAQLKARYANVAWMGVLPRPQLARVYAAADVFVFPSRNETFGLVMLEAMACGTPVAAYPVDGPLQVLGAETG